MRDTMCVQSVSNNCTSSQPSSKLRSLNTKDEESQLWLQVLLSMHYKNSYRQKTSDEHPTSAVSSASQISQTGHDQQLFFPYQQPSKSFANNVQRQSLQQIQVLLHPSSNTTGQEQQIFRTVVCMVHLSIDGQFFDGPDLHDPLGDFAH